MSEYQQFQRKKIQLQTQSDALLDAVIAYPQALDTTPVEVFIQEMKRDLSFNVLCIGDFSSGKTTFVNTFLIEDDLLPAKARPTTTRLTEVQYGEKLVAHIINPDGKVHAITEHVKETLEGHVVSGGEHVDTTALVRIFTPSKALAEGVVVIDSPGLNDPDIERMKITLDYLHQADAVLYFLNAQQAWTKSQKEFLEGEILGKDELDKLFFMLNYWDCIENDDREDLLDYIRDEMTKSLSVAHQEDATPPDLIPISAKTGEGMGRIQEDIWGYLSSAKEKIVHQKVHKLLTYIEQYIQMADEQAALAQEKEAPIAVKKEKLKADVAKYRKEAEKHLQRLRLMLELELGDFQGKCESILENYVVEVRAALNPDEMLTANNIERLIISRTSGIESSFRSRWTKLNGELQRRIRAVVLEWQGMLQIPLSYINNMEQNYLHTQMKEKLSSKVVNSALMAAQGIAGVTAAGGVGTLLGVGGQALITTASTTTTAATTGMFSWVGSHVVGAAAVSTTNAATAATLSTLFSGGGALVVGVGVLLVLKNYKKKKKYDQVAELADDIVQQANGFKEQLFTQVCEQEPEFLNRICSNVDFEVKERYQQKVDELDALGSNTEAEEEALCFKEKLLDLHRKVRAL